MLSRRLGLGPELVPGLGPELVPGLERPLILIRQATWTNPLAVAPEAVSDSSVAGCAKMRAMASKSEL